MPAAVSEVHATAGRELLRAQPPHVASTRARQIPQQQEEAHSAVAAQHRLRARHLPTRPHAHRRAPRPTRPHAPRRAPHPTRPRALQAPAMVAAASAAALQAVVLAEAAEAAAAVPAVVAVALAAADSPHQDRCVASMFSTDYYRNK